MLPASRTALAAPSRRFNAVRVVLTRRLATASGGAPKKSRSFFRTTLLYTTIFGTVFYAGSTAAALGSDRYHDFFVESVPLGEAIMDYAESQGWDQIRLKGFPKQAVDTTKGVYSSVEGAVSRTFGEAQSQASATAKSVQDAGSSAKETVQSRVDKAAKSAPNLIQYASSKTSEVSEKVQDVVDTAKRGGIQAAAAAQEEAKELVSKAEAALNGSKPVVSTAQGGPPKSTSHPGGGVEYYIPVSIDPSAGKTIYSSPLPIGHEPPPGFTRPAPKKAAQSDPKATAPPPELPLLAPSIKDLSASEPVLAQIAASIDGLSTLLRDSPASASGAKDIIDTAQIDLRKLGDRIEEVKKAEHQKLQTQLDEQAKEYSTKMLQLEIDAQDKIDAQEEGFKSLIEQQRQEILEAYRAKLGKELETQSQIINERLKEEVIAQGIEMQRRWIREIKVRVEQERGGRLSKLDELATGLKKLERVTLDNSSLLDENVRLHTLWSALRAFNSALDATSRRPFREELRVLRNVAAARDDPVIAAALSSIEQSMTPDVGVEPLGDLTVWFTSSVAPRLEGAALVPDENAGVLAHLASSALSSVRFKRKGLVEGSDVSSVVARAEHFLNEKDLDSAARELNQLKGTSKALLADWLAAARKRLEVEQALNIIRSQATLSSLLVV